MKNTRMNKDMAGWKRRQNMKTRHMMIAVLMTLGICLTSGAGYARISDPDVIFYGHAKDNGVTLTDATVALYLSGNANPLVSYEIEADGRYILRVPMDSLDPRTAGSARTGDIAQIYVNNVPAVDVTIPAMGTLVNLDADTGPPDTALTGTPASLTNQPSADFSFISTEAGSTFECSIDGSFFAACTAPLNYSGLADGAHTFQVRAKDNAERTDPTPASYAWTVDTVAPASFISRPLAFVIGSAFTVRGTASDVGSSVSAVEVSINDGPWQPAPGASSWNYPWTIPAEGTYTISSRATDLAGNIEVPSVSVSVNAYDRDSSVVSLSGRELRVNGSPLTIKGVNYLPVPVGDDPETAAPYGDYFTSAYNQIYNRDLPLLRQMGANTVRLSSWDNTSDHNDFLDAAYNGGNSPVYVIAGFRIDPGLDIVPGSSGNVREELKATFKEMVETHKNHPAILMWEIGNDLNDTSMYGSDPANLFSLIEEMASEAHSEDPNHPVTTALAGISLIETISAYDSLLPSLDVWGANLYRGKTFGTLFDDFAAATSRPLAIQEYGIDAYDTVHQREYENSSGTAKQAVYDGLLWSEISARNDVCLGGSVMEYSDQWWAGAATADPDCTDTDPAAQGICGFDDISQPDGYSNEEWWGIMRTRDNGTDPDIVEPRAAYYKLQSLWLSIPQYKLTVTRTGSGTVASIPGGISCGSNCSEWYNSGMTVELNAVPAANSVFIGWTGACTGAGSCSVTMDGDKSVDATFSLLPRTPGGLWVKSISEDSIVLRWYDNAKNETGYEIQRAEGACEVASAWADIATTGANSITYTDVALASNTTYSYRVRAAGATGNSDYSNCDSARTGFPGSPVSPSNLSAVASLPGRINLSWKDNSTSETSFRIYRRVDSGGWTLLSTVGADVTAFSDMTANGNNISSGYSYYVVACNSAGCSPTTAWAIVPHWPAGLSATASQGLVSLTWTDNSDNENGFRLFRISGDCLSAGAWATIADITKNVQAGNDTSASAGVLYSYKVRAYARSLRMPYAYGYSGFSECVSVQAQ